MNLVLIGYRGSGKTTAGSLVARRLGMGFTDLDELIVKAEGKSIREIFATEGEAGFRQREKDALKSLGKSRKTVIALGGGALSDSDAYGMVKRLGKIVWLRAPAVVLWSRITRDAHTLQQRPDLTPVGGLAEIEAVLAQRDPIYEKIAHHIIDTMSMTPVQVAEAIELWFKANDSAGE